MTARRTVPLTGLVLVCLTFRSPIAASEEWVVESAEAEALEVSREVELFAPDATRAEFVIVLSRALQESGAGARGSGGDGGLGATVSGESDEPGSSPADDRLREFRGLLTLRTPDGAAPETRFGLAGKSFRESDEALRGDGFRGVKRYRDEVAGERLWAALYRRDQPPESARLGDAEARFLVRFGPEVETDRAVRLQAVVAEVAITPADAPQGVEEVAWYASRREARRSLREEAQRWVDGLNAKEIRVPDDARYVFEAGDPYLMVLDEELGGETHRISLVLRGASLPREAASVEPAISTELLAGPWTLELEDPHHGIIGGFADLTEDGGGMALHIDFPDEPYAENLSCRSSGSVAGARFLDAGCINTWAFRLEIHRDLGRMRGYWYRNEGQSELGGMREEMKIGRSRWRRMEPRVDSVEVVALDPPSLDYREMQDAWPTSARLLIRGSELPRYPTDAVAELPGSADADLGGWFTGGIRGLRQLELPDPHLADPRLRATGSGKAALVDFALLEGVEPGAKILRLNGVPIEFFLEIENAADDRAESGDEPPPPRISFLTEPGGPVRVGGGRYENNLSGRYFHEIPTGQRFWIEVDYTRDQAESTKVLTLAWPGGSLDVELELVDAREKLYRGGPYLIPGRSQGPEDLPQGDREVETRASETGSPGEGG